MPRRPRIAVANIPWHIVQRGHNRDDCFFADEDYMYYLDQLQRLLPAHDCALHAYVLMTNHVHLLLTPKTETGAGALMKSLSQRYVQYVNKTHARSGTVWEGRYRSSLVQSETYVLACYRYIELNPVRAGMTKHPGDYRWSSFGQNALGHPPRELTDETGKKFPNLITPQREYRLLGEEGGARRAAYKALFRTKMDEATTKDITAKVLGGYVLGNERFARKIAATVGRRVVPGLAGRPKAE
jgi:putative transposase